MSQQVAARLAAPLFIGRKPFDELKHLVAAFQLAVPALQYQWLCRNPHYQCDWPSPASCA
jgi:hypothetical protein